MIDGITIRLSYIPAKVGNMPYIEIKKPYINPQTLEKSILVYKRIKYKGLQITTMYNNSCEIKGSVAKFYNQGKDNAYDYTYSHFIDTLNLLAKELGITPHKATLHTFEIGVNINLPFSCSHTLHNLIVYAYSRPFHFINKKDYSKGYIVDFENYEIKIYDKGKTIENENIKRLLRFELKIKTMHHVKDYGIKYLADLANPEIWNPLSYLLLKSWDNCMYMTITDFKYSDMSNFQQKKFKDFINPKFWMRENLGDTPEKVRDRRKQQKKAYHNLCEKYRYKNEKEILTFLITEKLEKLKPENSHILPTSKNGKSLFSANNFDDKKYPHFNPLDDRLKCGYKGNRDVSNFSIENKKDKKPEILIKNSTKKCLVCHDSLKFKSSNAKYCSKQCNNKYHTQKRKRMRDKIKKDELKNLDRILKIISKNRLWLEITYTDEKINYTDTLHQREILTPSVWIRKIKTVKITGIRKNTLPIVLTSLRAKKLIRILARINKHQQTKKQPDFTE